jgi:tetratricopeptide (TPR) repeat protein/energy-coupling factor transporter ATP-binding protein EcfA2
MAAPIGREQEFDALLSAARAAVAGQGSIVFLAGATGSGKSFLLNAVLEAVASSDASPRPEVVSVRCYETSAGNPLGPFGEVLRALTSRERRSDRAKRVLELVGQVAPSLVELIPVIGKLAALGVKAAADAGVYALGGDHEAQQAERAADVAVALQHVADEIPLVVVLDDAHWIDAPSTEVIARLADRADGGRLLMLVAYDEDLVADRHTLARVRSAVVSRPSVRRIRLEDFGRETIDSLLRDRYGGDVPDPYLADWLLDRTDGSPLFVEQYLTALEEQGVLRQTGGGWSLDGAIGGSPGDWQLSGALAQAQTPDTLLELLRPRVADLDDEERSLLESGAIQGRRFLSTVLVKLLDRDEDEILDRLERLEQRRRMIVVEQGEDWWSDRSNLYSFDPSVLQELLYSRYARSAYERRRRHRAVALALEALIAEDKPPPRHALLEIAQHYEDAGDLPAAARRLVEVAESTFAEGADRETAANAERAVAWLRTALAGSLEPDARREAQQLFARAIVLLLLGGEASWRASPTAGGGDGLVALAEEGKQAADAAGDPVLRANTRYASGRILTAYRGLDEAIEAYREALALARVAGDVVGEFAILMNLGHQLDSVSLTEGWDVLQEAHTLMAEGALTDLLDAATIARETERLETVLGVAAFDLGRYGEALDLLGRTVEAVRTSRRREDAAWAMAFLGQLYTAIGLYEDAERTLREGIAVFDGERSSLGLRGYLRALLGRLYLEWDSPRLAEARDVLVGAREEALASGYRAVEPLVQAHWAELLLAEGTPGGLREADAVLEAVETFGWARSAIAIGSLRARVALAEDRLPEAVELSTAALERLTKHGGEVPAVRSEEILFTHARVLAAAGSPDAEYAAAAARTVRAKAASLEDPQQREAFLKRVRLSRAVIGGDVYASW